jgi:hypothetical protein
MLCFSRIDQCLVLHLYLFTIVALMESALSSLLVYGELRQGLTAQGKSLCWRAVANWQAVTDMMPNRQFLLWQWRCTKKWRVTLSNDVKCSGSCEHCGVLAAFTFQQSTWGELISHLVFAAAC